MKKFALLVCLVLAGLLAAVPALAGVGNVNVTSDTACPAIVGTDNQIAAGDAINVWVSGNVDTGAALTWTITDPKAAPLTGALTYVCTDANTGQELWTTGLTGGSLSANLGGGNKTSESYTLAVTYTETGPTVGGDGFRRV